MPYESLGRKRGRPKGPKAKTPSIKLSLEMLIRGLYQLPMMAGQGAHWPLNDGEADVLASQTEACLTSLPSRQLDRANKFVAQIAPWIGLVTSVFVVTYARVQETRRNTHPSRPAPDAVPGRTRPAADGTGADNGAASGRVSPRLSDLFGTGDGPGFAGGPE